MDNLNKVWKNSSPSQQRVVNILTRYPEFIRINSRKERPALELRLMYDLESIKSKWNFKPNYMHFNTTELYQHTCKHCGKNFIKPLI